MGINNVAKVSFRLFFLFVGLWVMPVSAFGPPHGMGEFLHPRMLRNLDLSDAQKDQIESLKDKYRDENQELISKVEEAKENLEDMVFMGSSNKDTLKEAFGLLSPLLEDHILLRAEFITELKALLTEEQLELLEEIRADFLEQKKSGFRFRPSGM